MKTLAKIKVINWHYFWNETIDMKPIVFLTGVNASGKSTLIDALQVVLLGDTSGRYFNKAAMDKSNRTLKGYLRGELGDTEDGGFKYLRDGRFTSYIALEFYDDAADDSFTLGCVFDSFEDGHEEHRFFLLEDKIPKNEFITNNIPMSFKDLSMFFQTNYKEKYKFTDSNKQFQDLLKRKCGNLKDKYFSLLKKATSFTPITDITTFITEYVCDPQMNIEIGAMQENIAQYQQLEHEASLMGERIIRLEEIQNLYQKYLDSTKDIKLCSYIIEKVNHQISVDRLSSYFSQLEQLKKRLGEIDVELNEAEFNKIRLNNKKIQLINDKANSDTYRLTNQLYEEKDKLHEKISDLTNIEKDTISSIENYANLYISAATSLSRSFESVNKDLLPGEKVREIVELQTQIEAVRSKSMELLEATKGGLRTINSELLTGWREALSTFKSEISALSVSFARTIRDLEITTSHLKVDLDSLGKGIKSYDSSLTSIKNELSSQLKIQFGREISVEFFADLIDINDKKWSNAIEGFLFNQKFNLFVEPKYYEEAYKILKNLLYKYRYYGISLVDQEKIVEKRFGFQEYSLAEEIITDHAGARAYANFLLGRLTKCDNINEARESGNGITASCDIYRNFALSTIRPQQYATSYIGCKISSEQISQKKEEIATNIMSISTFKDLFKVINSANQLETINTNEINSIIGSATKILELKGLKESLKYVEEELSKHDTLQIDSLDKRIVSVEEDLTDIDKETNNLRVEKGSIIESIKNLTEDKIKNESAMLSEKEKLLQTNYDAKFVSEFGLPKFRLELETKSLLEIHKEYSVTIGRIQYISSNILGQVRKLRKSYTDDYHLSYNIEGENNDEFDHELIDIRDVKLPLYREKIRDSYNKATEQFKNEFISKLRNQIENVEDQISDLNIALSNSTFGNDTYKFTVKPNPTYRRYYDMFKDDLLLQTTEKQDEFINKYSDVMADLFKSIIVNDGKQSNDTLLNIDVFTDYRTYLDFDLLVTNKEGISQRLSKMIKKKSGGETQTPFYIAVLASFAQLYHVNETSELGNTIRLIVFDEAFSKMDRNRIKESIKLLRKFGLQAIISAPSEKIGDISESVDETLVVLHGKSSSSIRLYAKED
ncbi:MAG: SbcC/MukB-like Walker B domain-containing protein [Bacilli bacterium]